MDNSTGPVTPSPTDVYLFELQRRLWIYVGWTVIVCGTIGHILTLLVILPKRPNRTHAIAVYMTALSLSGLLALYTGLLSWIIYAQTGWEIHLKSLSNESCKIHTGLSYFSLQYVSWIQATIAVDRALLVTRPLWYKVTSGWKVPLVVTLVELVLCVSLNLTITLGVEINTDGYCAPKQSFPYLIWSYIDFLSFSVIPAIIIITCNSIILISFCRSEELLHDNATNRLTNNATTSRYSGSVTRMLVSVNIIFLLTTIPISVMYFIRWTVKDHTNAYVLALIYAVFSLLQYFGNAATFLIYCLSGSKFRDQLKRMITDTRNSVRSTLLSETTHV